MFLSYSLSRKPDLPVTLPLPSSTWLSVLFPFFLSFSSIFFSPLLKPRCYGRVMGFVGGGGNIAIVSALPLSSFLIVVSIYS